MPGRLPMPSDIICKDSPESIKVHIKNLAKTHGFGQCTISDTDTSKHHPLLQDWLDKGMHGEMEWMTRHLALRQQADLLLDNAKSVISVRLDYLSENTDAPKVLKQGHKAYISRYSLGRDYHKLMRSRLAKLAKELEKKLGGNYRALVDSAPVLERHFAEKGGMGWIGKNTMLMNRQAGSWFFLGEIYTDIELSTDDTQVKNHCGSCSACLDICPTNAFVAPYKLDARKCISYLTIELKGTIPEEYRQAMGNRVFGCDDCQLVCPWNRFAKYTKEDDFKPRHKLQSSDLSDLFLWDEQTFLNNTAGSPIRRLGYERWLRNLSIGLGNAPTSPGVIKALEDRRDYPSSLVQEHVGWALHQHLKNTER